MTWQTTTPDHWKEIVAQQVATLSDAATAQMIGQLQLVPPFAAQEGITAGIHQGSLQVDGDFRPEALITVILGDLDVTGLVSTQEVAGFDGNATLIVFGALRCHALFNDWASLVIVSADVQVRDYVYAAQHDSSLIIGGDFDTPVFLGMDIWASVGGQARIGSGVGYAVPIAAELQQDFSQVTEPKGDWQAMAAQLGIAEQTYEKVLEVAETRFYQTGTLLP